MPLRRFLPRHVVDTLFEKGWSEKDNGELLDLAEAEGYEVLVTTDQNIRYQQELTGRRIAIVVLLDTKWAIVRERAEEIAAAVDDVQPGEVREVSVRNA